MALTLANLEGEESFDASMLGQADEVVQERICDDELIVIKRWVNKIFGIIIVQTLLLLFRSTNIKNFQLINKWSQI